MTDLLSGARVLTEGGKVGQPQPGRSAVVAFTSTLVEPRNFRDVSTLRLLLEMGGV